ncbi:MAG: HAMP domain-containing histidine kinase [Chloroflexi bacterium]|nr:HAMP domain-containing histidine kinase [Chloroflexota bacterium]
MTSTQTRLTFANAVIIFLAAVLFALILVPLRAAVMQHVMDTELQRMGERVAQAPTAGVLPPTDVFAPHPIFIQAVRLDGSVQSRSANFGDAQLPVDPANLTRARSGNGQPWFDSIAVDGHLLRTYERPTLDGIVEVASPLDDGLPRGPLLLSLIVGMVLGVVGAVAAGWLLARVALAPVERLAVAVDSISSTDDLGRRIPIDPFGTVRLDPVVRLTHAFNAMLDRLQLSTERLTQSLQLQRQFVGDASHQLRTPLTSLRGNVDLLSRMCAEDCPLAALDQHQLVLADLNVESERMSRLVDGLLVLARADAQQHLNRVPTDLEPLIKGAWRTATALSDSVTVELGQVAHGVRVSADPDRLMQLFVILLENAVRYSPPGGHVWLRAALQDRHARAGVEVEVADAGPGIPVDERVRIFERFYRVRSTESMTEGVGLGLAVARWLASEHEAEISLSDNTPVGSIFGVWLPLLDGEARGERAR